MLRLKFERLARGWRQRDVALHPELRTYPRLFQTDICDIELGRRIPTREQLEALGRVFNLSPASLLLKPVVLADVPARERDAEAVAR